MSYNKEFDIINGVLISYLGMDSHVVVPDDVVEIGPFSFSNRVTIESVVIPDGVKAIGNHAFFMCTDLKSIEIPDSVISIGSGAFSGCQQLESISLPDGVIAIENELFMSCKKLASARFSSGVISFGDEAFRGCEAMQDENGFVIINNILYDYYSDVDDKSREVVIPDGVTEIGSNAFYSSDIEHIVIPSSVHVIGRRAFMNCKHLRSITFSGGDFLTRRQAFICCDSLERLAFLSQADHISDVTMEFLWRSFVSSGKVNRFACLMLSCCAEIVRQMPGLQLKIKRNKERIAIAAVRMNMVSALETLFSLCRMVRVQFLDRLIATADDNSLEVRAFLVDYKNKHYPAELLEKMEREEIDKALGLRPRTVTDYRRVFSLRYTDSGIAIKKCKADEEVMIIPSVIGDREVICIDSGAFYGLKSTRYVSVPKTITTIAENAFDNSGQLAICACENTEAQGYAQRNNIKFIVMGEDFNKY